MTPYRFLYHAMDDFWFNCFKSPEEDKIASTLASTVDFNYYFFILSPFFSFKFFYNNWGLTAGQVTILLTRRRMKKYVQLFTANALLLTLNIVILHTKKK